MRGAPQRKGKKGFKSGGVATFNKSRKAVLNLNPNIKSSSEKNLSSEQILEHYVYKFWQSPEELRDIVARDFIYDLIHLIEKAGNMHTSLAKLHLKSLYARWLSFCRRTEVDIGKGECIRYEEALLGSAVILLNDGNGRDFIIKEKMLWSRDSMQQFMEWVLKSDDDSSKFYAQWIQKA